MRSHIWERIYLGRYVRSRFVRFWFGVPFDVVGINDRPIICLAKNENMCHNKDLINLLSAHRKADDRKDFLNSQFLKNGILCTTTYKDVISTATD